MPVLHEFVADALLIGRQGWEDLRPFSGGGHGSQYTVPSR
jgi:hypothetical protein